MSHGHADLDGEWYGMPERRCIRCKGTCCSDCAAKVEGGWLCPTCESLDRMRDDVRREVLAGRL